MSLSFLIRTPILSGQDPILMASLSLNYLLKGRVSIHNHIEG